MSSDVVIRVENLGKLYRIGQRGTHADDLRHRLNRALTYPFRKLWTGAVSREPRADGNELAFRSGSGPWTLDSGLLPLPICPLTSQCPSITTRFTSG